MILVDSNILMYAVGADHPHRQRCITFLERVLAGLQPAIVDAEVLQEILHRYRSLGRWKKGREVYDDARLIFPNVLAITAEVMDSARKLMESYPNLGTRDAVHAGVATVYKLESICSFDRDFDEIVGLRRIEP